MPAYKLATYQSPRGPRAGLMLNDAVYDLEGLTGKPSHAAVLSLLEDWQAAGRDLRVRRENLAGTSGRPRRSVASR